MKEPSSDSSDWDDLRRQIIGLGEDSHRKNYYPELKQSREALVRFRSVMEEIPDIILIVGPDDRILDMNRTALSVLGAERSCVPGMQAGDLLGPAYHEMKNEGTTVLRSDPGRSGIVCREMEIRPVRVAGQSLWVVLGRDVSRRVRTEEKLKELNQNLEALVLERTKEIEKQMRRLEDTRAQLVDAEKMAILGRLVAGVAHEINTPLGIGVTASSSLIDEVDRIQREYSAGTLSESDFFSFLSSIEESSRLLLENLKRAADLVRSFKLIAADSRHEQKRSINLREYVDSVVRSLYPEWKKHRLQVHGNLSTDIFTDPGDWSMILTNLIVNSVAHGFRNRPEGGLITVDISEDDDVLVLEYRDDGIGLDDEQTARIFEPFFTTARSRGGTGLGMSIVYNLITLKMGGTIRHVRDDQPGAFFVIRVPRTDAGKGATGTE